MHRSRQLPLVAAIVLMTVWFCAAAANGASGAAAQPPKEAVLIVAFGTSFEKARASYDAVENLVRAACPDKEIRWAWTAHSLLGEGPERRLSPQEALARLATEGVKEVNVLSLHVIPGQEYANLLATARAFTGLPKGLESVRVSPPLLWDSESLREVAELLLQSVPEKRRADEGVIFVGHGTHHPSGVYYGALQYYLSLLDPNAFVGTVEGDPDREAVRAAAKARKLKKIWLIPLMTVAGDHALNDLFGDGQGSWKRIFASDGLHVETVQRGLGEVPAFAARWVEGLKE